MDEDSSNQYGENTLLILGFISSLLAFVGGLFTVIVYWIVPATRKNFFFFLAFHLAISDLGVATTGLSLSDPESLNQNFCAALATIRGFAIMSSMILNILIALFLYKTVQTNNYPYSFSFHKAPFLLINYSFALFGALGPLLSNAYGPSDIYCWISNNDTYITTFWLISEAYITLPASLVWIILLYCLTIRLLRKSVTEEHKSNMNKLAVVPLVYVVCNGMTLVDILFDYCFGPIFTIKIIHICMRQMQGLLHALLYGFGIIKEEIINKWNERRNRNLLQEEFQMNKITLSSTL